MNNMLTAVVLAVAVAAPLRAQIAPGQPAPDFTLNDQNGAPHKLSDAKGKYVVLEWYNKGCPFVRRHYDSKNMQHLQKTYADKGVVWYTIASSAPGKQGSLTPKNALSTWTKEEGTPSAAHPFSSTLLLDSKSDVARLYGAKTTPHMFIIDPKGNVIYMGAIDDNPSTDVAELKGAHNYVAAALDASMTGKAVPNPVTQSYGCSVKY